MVRPRTLDIHLVSLGRELGHVEPAIRKYRPNYIVFNTNESGEIYEEACRFKKDLETDEQYRTHLMGVEILGLNPFEADYVLNFVNLYVETRERLHSTFRKEPGVKGDKINWWANVTGGTNAMAAATAITALIFGMRVYYVLPHSKHRKLTEEELVLEVPAYSDIHNGMVYGNRNPAQAMILRTLKRRGPQSSNQLQEDLQRSASSISQRIRPLIERGFVDRDQARNATFSLTPIGRVVAHLIDI